MKIRDLIDGLKQNKYTVKFLDHWADIKDPMAYFIERMEHEEEQAIEWHKKCCESENTKHLPYVSLDPTELTFVDGGQCYIFFGNYLKLYSYITGGDAYIIINDSEITFKTYRKDETGRSQLQDIRPLPQLKDVPTWQIPVPSGKLTFTNSFDKKVCPDMSDRYSSENSLCVNVPINGNRATCKHYFEDVPFVNDLGCLNYCHIFIDKV